MTAWEQAYLQNIKLWKTVTERWSGCACGLWWWWIVRFWCFFVVAKITTINNNQQTMKFIKYCDHKKVKSLLSEFFAGFQRVLQKVLQRSLFRHSKKPTFWRILNKKWIACAYRTSDLFLSQFYGNKLWRRDNLRARLTPDRPPVAPTSYSTTVLANSTTALAHSTTARVSDGMH